MKIYIENYKPTDINNIILSRELDTYFKKKNTVHEIYSQDGIYHIHNNNIYKLKHTTTNNINNSVNKPKKILNYFNETKKYRNVIIDFSFMKNDLYYKIPPIHVCSKTEMFIYSRAEKSLVELVVKGFYEKREIELNKKETNHFLSKDKYLNFVVTDFYFDIKDGLDIDDINMREDLEFFYNLLGQ